MACQNGEISQGTIIVASLRGPNLWYSDLQQCFECLICKETVCFPAVMSPCCIIVGCQICVEQWLTNYPPCPQCRAGMGGGWMQQHSIHSRPERCSVSHCCSKSTIFSYWGGLWQLVAKSICQMYLLPDAYTCKFCLVPPLPLEDCTD